MSETLTIDFRQPIPLFPLPNCVLLPHATIPLHIFEPRYRKMVNDALDSSGLIAMATFEGDEWKHEYEGKPPLRPHVCVGYILKHQLLEDGRFNLWLQGACRARVREEVTNKPYRKAILEPLERETPMEIDLAEQRVRLEALLNDPLLLELERMSALRDWISREVPTNALIDLTTMTVCQDLNDRYAVLSEPNAEARAAWLERWLRETRRTLRTAKKFEPPKGADRINVN